MRFYENVKFTPDCWVFKYETFYLNERHNHYRPHRFSYEIYKGKIPKSFYVKRTCKTKRCVRPDHIKLWPYKNIFGDNSKKTHCPYGHKYEGSNLYLGTQGERRCRTCNRESQNRFRLRKRNLEQYYPVRRKVNAR
jgi:hypothetical protein